MTTDILKLYRDQPYLDAYSAHTDLRVSADPKEAVGGMWEQIGRLQFEFLVASGLTPDKTILDIGCGTLRGGRHFIAYLAAERYTGFDISANAIEAAMRLVQKEGLDGNSPVLLLNDTKRLDFTLFPGKTFDFLLAHSVFSHLPPDSIEECFRNIGTVMHAHSLFFFTFIPGDRPARVDLKSFQYPFGYFERAAERHGFEIEDCSAAYRHPRGQCMAKVRKVPVKAREKGGC